MEGDFGILNCMKRGLQSDWQSSKGLRIMIERWRQARAHNCADRGLAFDALAALVVVFVRIRPSVIRLNLQANRLESTAHVALIATATFARLKCAVDLYELVPIMNHLKGNNFVSHTKYRLIATLEQQQNVVGKRAF
jgi:hypothetical protein